MRNLLQRFWADDGGAVISVELILVVGVLVFGTIPGLIAFRNSILSTFATTGGTLTSTIVQSAKDASVAVQTPPPYTAKTLNYPQSVATSYSVSGSHTNVYVNVQIPSRFDIPSP